MRNDVIHRITCMRCGLTFTCEHPTSNDSSWNRYALHTYECDGRGLPGYEHDMISTGPFDPVPAQPSWRPAS